MDAHCDVCEAYETAVMAHQAGEETKPCDDYEMTETFKQWMVDQLRDEVLGQISGSGLDRMTIVKADDDQNSA